MGHMVFGLLAVCAGLLGVFIWWDDFGLVLRGLIPITFIVVGLIGVGASLIGRNQERRESPLR